MSSEAIPFRETSTGDRLRSITAAQGSEFREGLRSLINRCSLENGCDLADDVIADYLVNSYLALCATRTLNCPTTIS